MTMLTPNYLCFFLAFLVSYQLAAQFPEGLRIMNQNLVINGDFSQGNEGFQSDYHYTDEESYAYGPLADEGEYGVLKDPSFIHHMFMNCGDHTGNKDAKMMVLNGSPTEDEIIWSQKIKVKPHTNYVFSCWIASALSESPAQLQFRINGINHKDPILASSTTCEWKQFSTLWESEVNEYIVISIVNKNTTMGGNDFLLDDISFFECIPPRKKTNTKGYLHSAADLTCEQLLILDNVQFHDNSSKFKGMIAANQTLFLIFEYMKENPHSTLTLYGHTDVFGSPERNLELSKERVVKIQRWLTMYGIKAHRIDYEWYGSQKPLVPEGDISNRRVEIKLHCGDVN